MPYLPNLIKKIDEFYKIAVEPEDEYSEEGEAQTIPYFEELEALSHQVAEPELSLQLQVLAELYRYAIQMGGGYATIARAIDNLKNMYSDDESISDIEYILNGMVKELAKHAGGVRALAGTDNPRFIQRLAQLKEDVESRFQPETLDAFQEELNPYGASGESEEDLAASGLTPDEAEIINPAALGFGNKEDPKANKGWHTVGSGIPYKNWREYYENERISYESDRARATDPGIQKSLDELIELLPKLSRETAETLRLSDEQKVAPSEAGQKVLDQKKTELRELKKARHLLKNRIRYDQLEKSNQELERELSQETDPKVRQLLEQRMQLNNLNLSKDLYKAKERNYRLALIRSMSGGNFPGAQTLEDFKRKIQEASQLRITKQDYDRKQTKERAGEHGKISEQLAHQLRGLKDVFDKGWISKQEYDIRRWELLAKERGSILEVVPEREKRRGGGRAGAKINLFDYDLATFNGLVQKYSDKVNTAVNTARQGVTQEVTSGGKVHNALKPMVDKLSKAIQKKDDKAKYDAIKELKSAIVDWSSRAPALRVLEKNVRLLPFFNKLKEEFKNISQWRTDDGQWSLDEQKTDHIAALIEGARRLTKIYSRFYTKPAQGQLELFFDKALEQLEILVQRIEKETGISPKQASFEWKYLIAEGE